MKSIDDVTKLRIARLTPLALAMESRLGAWRRITADLQTLSDLRDNHQATVKANDATAASLSDRITALHNHVDGLDKQVAGYAAMLKSTQEAVTEAERNLRQAQHDAAEKMKAAREADQQLFICRTMSEIGEKLAWLPTSDETAAVLLDRYPNDPEVALLRGLIANGASLLTAYRAASTEAAVRDSSARVEATLKDQDASAAKNRDCEARYQRAFDAFMVARLNATQIETIKNVINQYRAEAAEHQISEAKARRASESAKFSIQQIDQQCVVLQRQLDSLRVDERRDGDRLARARKRIQFLTDRTRFMEDQNNVGAIETTG